MFLTVFEFVQLRSVSARWLMEGFSAKFTNVRSCFGVTLLR
jgi:hypothetical protein